MPGSDRYLASVAKKRVDQFPAKVNEKSEQIRQYQEIVSELIGVCNLLT